MSSLAFDCQTASDAGMMPSTYRVTAHHARNQDRL